MTKELTPGTVTTFGNLEPGMNFKLREDFRLETDEPEIYMKINTISNSEKEKKTELERISNLIADSVSAGDAEKTRHLTLYSMAVMDNDGKNAVKYLRHHDTLRTKSYTKLSDDTEVIYMIIL